MIWLVYLIGFLALLVAALAGWRAVDGRADQSAWKYLAGMGSGKGRMFDPAMVTDLPEPARRYFRFTIQPGTPLHMVVEIDMTGELGLGTMAAPNYQSMQARQILAPPQGLVWKVKTGAISGSDGALPESSWTRFWLFGLFPVVRASGPDHRRSAFGRVAAEAAFWAPASLLPGDHVRWEPLDENGARAFVQYGAFEQAVDITVDDRGAPSRVVIQRWSNANSEKQFREQPFGGDLSDFREFEGYRLPTRVEGGNHIGTPDYFPFFKAVVTDIRFLGNGS
ncbi:MAG: hypothetical protein RJS97_02925 [Parvibaculaceae bacterium]